MIGIGGTNTDRTLTTRYTNYLCMCSYALNVHQPPEILEYFREQPETFILVHLTPQPLGCDLVKKL